MRCLGEYIRGKCFHKKLEVQAAKNTVFYFHVYEEWDVRWHHNSLLPSHHWTGQIWYQGWWNWGGWENSGRITTKVEIYRVIIRGNKDYETFKLEDIFSKLRRYEMNMKRMESEWSGLSQSIYGAKFSLGSSSRFKSVYLVVLQVDLNTLRSYVFDSRGFEQTQFVQRINIAGGSDKVDIVTVSG